jgi:hypothetical protein
MARNNTRREETFGPRALGHEPLIAAEQRERVLERIEETGAVDFRDDPLLPFLKRP